MAFSAPTLNENVSTISSVNTNFSLIQSAFETIQTILPRVQTVRLGGNQTWVDKQLRPDGVVGHQSFVPSIGSSSFAVTHDTPTGYSVAVLEETQHETNISFSQEFSTIITDDGDYEVCFGVRTRGSPICEMLLELLDTDMLQELTVWKMDVNKDGALWTVTNLRRDAPVHMNRDGWSKVIDQEVPLTYQYKGVLPEISGVLETGIIIPWNCEVQGAYVRLDTMPSSYTDQNDIVIELGDGSDTDFVNILSDQATFTERDRAGAIKELTAQADPYQMEAGDFVAINVVTPETPLNTDNPVTASDLSITLLVRQIYHDVRR